MTHIDLGMYSNVGILLVLFSVSGWCFFFFLETNVGLAHSNVHCHNLIKLQYVFTL